MKNLLKVFTIIMLLSFSITGSCQIGTGLENSLGLNVGNLRNGTGLKSVNNVTRGKTIEGSSLLFETNYSGRIGIKNSKLSGVVTLNYDLLTGVTIVYTMDDTYYIEPRYVDSLFIENPVNLNQVKFVKLSINGKETIMKILCDGKVKLLKEYSAKLLNPTYNAALDTGNKNYIVKKKHAYYVFYDGELKLLPKKPSKIFKKNILPRNFKKKFSSKKYSLKDEQALIEVFESLNESI